MNIKENENTFLKIIPIENNNNKKQIKSNLSFYYICISFILFFILFFELIILNRNIIHTNKLLTLIQKDSKHHDINLIEPYIKAQKEFCNEQYKFINPKYENQIFLSNAKFNEFNFSIYVFKYPNFLLEELVKYGGFEAPIGNYMIQALQNYSLKYNIINNKDIFILDIGGNVGWYPSILGRYGYTILSFEAFERNYYVAKKNYCHLNYNSNVIIITKGLGNKEKKCQYYMHYRNEGNGMVICDSEKSLSNKLLNGSFIKESNVELTTLNSFMPYLSDKKIALMKLDVEGYELHVLEGGKELITKYHIPFIVLEFSPTYLKEVGTEPKNLVQFLVDNGYKISLNGFFSQNYLTIEELFAKIEFQANCYFIYNKNN